MPPYFLRDRLLVRSDAVTPQRRELLRTVAGHVLELPTDRVGIDGVDGAGKTTFADELALTLEGLGRTAIRASIDGFHNPRVVRYRMGSRSPEGYFLDSYDYPSLRDVLLDPLGPGGSGRYRTAVFDYLSDSPVSAPERRARPEDVLVFDGIFLHRPELRGVWDLSVFLDVAFDVSISRCARRDPGFGPSDPEAEDNRRYVEGQRLYLRWCEPRRQATIVVDNNDLAAPYLATR
jgi:uridine kinase